MDDYISREAALSCFHDWIDRYGHEHSADEMTEYQRIEELPAADVVARDCYDRILAENDTMREMLARIGKKCGDSMDDVRPVVHGKWRNAHPSSPLFDAGGPPYCSVCGKEAPLRSVEVNQWKLERGGLSGPEVVYKTKCFLSNFCPNCGADMRANLDTTKGDNHD